MKTHFNPFNLIVFLPALFFISCTPKVNYGPDIYKPDASFKIVGYLSGWNFGEIDSLELNRLSYLNLAFGNPDKDGNLVFDDTVSVTTFNLARAGRGRGQQFLC